MVKLYRKFGNVISNIIIDDMVWEEAGQMLNSLFRTYTISYGENNEGYRVYNYYIVNKNSGNQVYGDRFFMFDTNNNHCYFSLINDLEDYYIEMLEGTVLHGSCLRVAGKTLLFLGERHSGKTTLTQFFTMIKDGEYLNDDCVYIAGSAYVGFGMPLPLRSLVNMTKLDQGCLAETIDFDGVRRTLYLPPNYLDTVSNIDCVIFPKYNQNGKNELSKLSKGEAFNRIMQNVRAYCDMKNMFRDINILVSSATCYCVEYTECRIVNELLEKEKII